MDHSRIKLHNKSRRLFVTLLIGLTFMAVFPLVGKYSGLKRKKKGFPENYLQVLVLTPTEVEIVHSQEELERYIKVHPDYSFLVPPGQQAHINEQLAALYGKRFKERGADAYPWVKVEQLGGGRQYLEVGLSGDPHELIVWYEATDKEIFPRYHQWFGAFELLAMVMLSAGITGIIWLSGQRILRICQRGDRLAGKLP